MAETSDIRIRALSDEDASALRRMLYLALFVPPGSPPLPENVVDSPEIARYICDWGRPGDLGFAAVDPTGTMIGAAWLRLMTGSDRGYGYVDDQTPELSIAVEDEYRSQGTGTQLLTRLLSAAAQRHPAVSLSVSAENPAVRLYQRLDFVTISEESGSLTLLKTFGAGGLYNGRNG